MANVDSEQQRPTPPIVDITYRIEAADQTDALVAFVLDNAGSSLASLPTSCVEMLALETRSSSIADEQPTGGRLAPVAVR